jgi:cell wall-associated NlpC family hydrolase
MNAPSFRASTNTAIMRHALLLLACLLSTPAAAWNDGASTDRDRPLIHALLALGVQYRYGGRSPETGFDCSGLITHVFERAWGMLLPPGTEALSKVGMPIKLKELEPGDLVFYNTRNRPYSHVGIYLGDGRFLHAPRPGASVRVESVQTPYWRARFNGARRLDPPTF